MGNLWEIGVVNLDKGFDESYTFGELIVKLVNLNDVFELSINDEPKGTFNIEEKVIILDWIERYSGSISLKYTINDNEFLSTNVDHFNLFNVNH